ncbi:MAG TPA: oligosaccharide flippase family protein [Mycobacteriales bacterium]|nr:oligosaccharide flippase family protein [Mycobacteriales bacterium]HVW81493.1 oligosaccharide flippase family protein [Mycobacteriales bacterium]
MHYTALAGRYALCLAIAAPTFMLASLSLRSVALSHQQPDLTLGDFYAARLLCSTVALALMVAVGVAIGGSLRVPLLLVGCAKWLDAIADIYFAPLQSDSRLTPMAVSIGLNGVLTFCLANLFAYTTGKLLWVVAGSVIGSFFASAVFPAGYLTRLQHSRRVANGSDVDGWLPLVPQWRRLALRTIVPLAAPLGVASGVVSLTNNVPRYVLDAEASSAALGVFAVLTYIINVSGLVAGATAQALLPQAVRMAKAANSAGLRELVHRAIARIAVLLVPAVVVSTLAAHTVVRFFFGQRYAEASGALTLALAGLGFTAVGFIVDMALTALGHYRQQLLMAVMVLSLSGVLSASVIPRFGITGAAWVVCIEVAARALGKYALLRHYTAQLRPERARMPYPVESSLAAVFLLANGGVCGWNAGMQLDSTWTSALPATWSLVLMVLFFATAAVWGARARGRRGRVS